MDDNVIDIEAEEREPLKSRLRRRRTRAKTGAGEERPTSKLFWVVLGGVVTAVMFRVVDSYWPRQPQALPPAPPPGDV